MTSAKSPAGKLPATPGPQAGRTVWPPLSFTARALSRQLHLMPTPRSEGEADVGLVPQGLAGPRRVRPPVRAQKQMCHVPLWPQAQSRLPAEVAGVECESPPLGCRDPPPPTWPQLFPEHRPHPYCRKNTSLAFSRRPPPPLPPPHGLGPGKPRPRSSGRGQVTPHPPRWSPGAAGLAPPLLSLLS